MTRTPGRPRRSILSSVQRQLQLIVLGHIWSLAPLAAVWFLVPGWRGANPPAVTLSLVLVTVAAGVYLVIRTLLTVWSWAGALSLAWPYVDAVLITAALVSVRSPRDALSVLYFIPIASGVALFNVPYLIGLTAAVAGGFALVVLLSGTPWAVDIFFRLVVLVLVASLYGRVIRLVTTYARAVERAEFQTELAREIHDGIQHLLVTLAARLELASRLMAEAPARAAAIVASERDTARRAADELRYLVRRGRAVAEGSAHRAEQDAGLAATLRAQLAATAERWPFALTLHVPAALPALPAAAELAILRVIQESLTNAAKHAQASSVEVTVAQQDGTLTCTIHDDGHGFDPGTAVEQGLAGLRERINASGGSLSIRSSAGAGTTVSATFPLARRERWLQSAS